MVGRLVQQQQIRFCQKQAGKGDLGFFTARERRNLSFQITLLKTETGQNTQHLTLVGIAAQILVFLLQSRIFIDQLFIRIFLHGVGQFFHLLFQILELGKDLIKDFTDRIFR